MNALSDRNVGGEPFEEYFPLTSSVNGCERTLILGHVDDDDDDDDGPYIYWTTMFT